MASPSPPVGGSGFAGSTKHSISSTEATSPTVSSVSQQLLAEVLGETLIRHQEDPNILVHSLQQWYQAQVDPHFDADVFPELIRHVLHHRLGERATRLPAELFSEVGLAIWNNEESRQRVQQLWDDLARSDGNQGDSQAEPSR